MDLRKLVFFRRIVVNDKYNASEGKFPINNKYNRLVYGHFKRRNRIIKVRLTPQADV